MPFADYLRQSCPTCGQEMKPLANTLFCPNDCDRSDGVPLEIDREITTEIRICTHCGSPDYVEQSYFGWKYYKCLDCSRTFH
jgi:NMD protein affecting ribosome stability and mRNA decay